MFMWLLRLVLAGAVWSGSGSMALPRTPGFAGAASYARKQPSGYDIRLSGVSWVDLGTPQVRGSASLRARPAAGQTERS